MIIEPTGWAIQCDRCEAELTCEVARVEDEQDMRDYVEGNGWINAPGYEFCSVDCLLKARYFRAVRETMAVATREHMATHADRCCWLHRTHATRGRHHWADCPDPKWAGVAVL